MKGKAFLGVLLALAVIAVPAAAVDYTIITPEGAGDDGNQVIAATDNNYGYLHVNTVEFTLKNTDADVTVTYSIEPWLAAIVSILGKDDLRKRVLGTIQYPETGYNQVVTFKYLDTERAVLHITNAAMDNQDNSYWFRAHTFGCTIPLLQFIFSDSEDVKEYTNVKEMSKGIGYFKS
ncbi:MAG TPA: hypothetical protein O0X42_00295 [Methanocorpusculum sp.]|nr:hypothetical protein [Methanocorpusculum sp.]